MDPKAFVSGMAALGAGIAALACIGAGSAFSEATAIYGLIVALILISKVV